jgi:SAM-dependent methyltransferase
MVQIFPFYRTALVAIWTFISSNAYTITRTISPRSNPCTHRRLCNSANPKVISQYNLHRSQLVRSLLSTGTDQDFEYSYDDSEAESQFGTKEYWDDMYIGMGDFDSEEYSWYFGFDAIKPLFLAHIPLPPKKQKSIGNDDKTQPAKMLVPGVGNDGTLLDLYNFGYHDIVAFDYSSNAIERQEDLLSYDSQALEDVTLLVRDGRDLDDEWTEMFDIVFEKGALDAIFLSGPGNVEKAVEELKRVLKTGGYMMSVSGVVPEELRREIFSTDDWEWVRDGSDDLKAGCFVLQKI